MVMLRQTRIEMDSLIAKRKWKDALICFAKYGDKYLPEIAAEDKLRLGHVHIELGSNIEDGVRLLEEAEKSGLRTAEVYNELAHGYVKLRRGVDAINMANKALAAEPGSIPAKLTLAEAYLGLSDIGEAAKQIAGITKRDVAKDPDLRDRWELIRSVIK
jgi:tetratricopeptide (TPR) repeat protein